MIIASLLIASTMSNNPTDNTPIDFGDTRFIAHRGLSSEYYENTASAFTAAGESDFFYGIETDIWQTLDKQFVCAHDRNPFDDRSKKIDQITLDEALELPLKNNSSPQKIATFEEFLDICSKYDKNAFIHLKITGISEADAKAILEILGAKEMLDVSTFISFSKADLDLIKQIYPAANVQVLYSIENNRLASFDFGENINSSQPKLTACQIAKAKESGVEVGVWTVNDIKQAQKFANMGVNYITTDCDFSKSGNQHLAIDNPVAKE